jgi:hypothetical protein
LQRDSATARNFAGDQGNNAIQRGSCGFLVGAHFFRQCSHKLGLGHRFCHF